MHSLNRIATLKSACVNRSQNPGSRPSGSSHLMNGVVNPSTRFPKATMYALARHLRVFCGQWRMSESATELLRGSLFALTNFPAVDHDVVFIGDAIDPVGSKRSIRKRFLLHWLVLRLEPASAARLTASLASRKASPELSFKQKNVSKVPRNSKRGGLVPASPGSSSAMAIVVCSLR